MHMPDRCSNYSISIFMWIIVLICLVSSTIRISFSSLAHILLVLNFIFKYEHIFFVHVGRLYHISSVILWFFYCNYHCVSVMAKGGAKDLNIGGYLSQHQSYMIKYIQDNSIDNIQIKAYFMIYIKAKKINITKKKKTNSTRLI